MKVLSLFDGISCGRVALERAGINVSRYWASEIEPLAIRVSKRNYPDIIHIGDVRNVDGKDYKGVDLLIAGSPCQDLSVMGKRAGLFGERSSLFFEYLRILREAKPKYFLLENVRMSKENEEQITSLLGVEPIFIDSALVSGAYRKRLYWTNIPGVTAPKDRNILFQDCLDSGYTPKDKAACLCKRDYRRSVTDSGLFRYFVRAFGNIVFPSKAEHERAKNYILAEVKRPGVTSIKKAWAADMHKRETIQPGTPGFGARRLTIREMERLMTFPEGYLDGESYNSAWQLAGNAWTVDVIAHIFSYIKIAAER